MSDRPTPRVEREHPFVSASAVVLMLALAVVVGWFIGSAAFVPPAQHGTVLPVASPVVIVQPPVVPAVLVKMAAAYVARATETAPTPTPAPRSPGSPARSAPGRVGSAAGRSWSPTSS